MNIFNQRKKKKQKKSSQTHTDDLIHTPCPTLPIARSLYLILGVYFMLVAVKLSVWLAADESRETVPSPRISCLLSLPEL